MAVNFVGVVLICVRVNCDSLNDRHLAAEHKFFLSADQFVAGQGRPYFRARHPAGCGACGKPKRSGSGLLAAEKHRQHDI